MAKKATILDVDSGNPRFQCSVCGRWMRLHGKDKDGVAFQRFYGSCGNGHSHDKNVCDECCQVKCPYRPENENYDGTLKLETKTEK